MSCLVSLTITNVVFLFVTDTKIWNRILMGWLEAGI